MRFPDPFLSKILKETSLLLRVAEYGMVGISRTNLKPTFYQYTTLWEFAVDYLTNDLPSG